jgi:hypothetical protein
MPTEKDSILAEIDALLRECEAVKGPLRRYDEGVRQVRAAEVSARLSASIKRLAPKGSQYRDLLEVTMKEYNVRGPWSIAEDLEGMVRALRADYTAGYLRSVEELIHADLFADLLEMAGYLLEEGYKDSAAVMAGGVLEEHLRKLCERNNIPTETGGRHKKAETLNAELAGAGVYSKLDQKSVTAWLDLRNKAAHGRYTEYNKEQVDLMVRAIREFVSRLPA